MVWQLGGIDMLAVRTDKLTKCYGNFRAVDELDLHVRKGEIYGLLGPNGAGKTTAIKVLAGLLRKTSGTAEVLDIEVPSKRVSQNIGYMPQETAMYLGLTTHQNIEFFGQLFGLSREQIAQREAELLRFVDLEDWKDELVQNLSGGMKHRVSLACALIHEPDVLFLDEPTVGVDPKLRVSFWKFFAKLKEEGKTIIITTHYMDEAKHCDRVGFMRHGKLIAEGAPSDLMRDAETDCLEDAYLKFAGVIA
jgi:ABC-2 type transport system ATP-binding protein